ncbi:DUF5309 domain-containing protein [Paenibacillus sp. J5C_2022]|uniref:DUF5309 domain-containing protein n=1 Tax=Paenibacillus sp. J5C2022 TaxID=2977129 RepID=UPI0021CF6E91|nr:DUF5309 domain-containing protein [Paenibacillus sp. J5C2022]MCU6709350.1 DUF5309 domain-containing protein [Paenibacillus sp. J5C2022]
MPALTYDFQDQVRQLEAGISLIIDDAPTLLGLVGMGSESLFQTKYEWMSDNLNSNRANVPGGAADVDTNITVAAGDGEKFRVNAIVVAGEEYMQVTAINGDVITVTRGFDGTTAAAIGAGDELRIVSRPQLQAAMPGIDESHDRYTDYNYTQIIERYAAVSGTQQSVRTYNVANELDYQVQLRLKEASRELNDWLIYGRRIQGQGNKPSVSGGLLYFAETNGAAKQNASGGEITPKMLNDLAESTFQRGGSVNTILTNTAGARQITKFAGDTIRTERTDTGSGHKIQTFVTDLVGGSVATVVIDPNFPKNKVALLDRGILSLNALQGRSLYDVDASIPGADFVARQIRGEYGITVKNAKEKVAVLENISTSVS